MLSPQPSLCWNPPFSSPASVRAFLQDLGGIEGETNSVASLFIEAPGAKTEKNNADLFQKRGRVSALGFEAAAMALFTLQTYAPSGGAGHRTSLRGGGPLTTLVVPTGDAPSLWSRLWLNVPSGYDPLPNPLDGTIFPWLAPTKTSESGARPLDFGAMHPLAAFWWMPRRIVLETSKLSEPTACNVTGRSIAEGVARYRTRPWGMNGFGVQHPLSPMYRANASDTEWLFVHPQPGGLPYHLWVDLAFAGNGTATRRPAAAVTRVLARRQSAVEKVARLSAAGYDMDNMKARGFVETTFPLFLLDGKASAVLEGSARSLVAGASGVMFALRSAVRTALRIDAKATLTGSLTRAFYDRTERAFFDAVATCATAYGADEGDQTVHSTAAEKFLVAAKGVALTLFDTHVPFAIFGIRQTEIERVIGAREALFKSLGIALPAAAPASDGGPRDAIPERKHTMSIPNAAAAPRAAQPSFDARAKAALLWWQDLQPSGTQRGDRAALARLRRAAPRDAMAQEATLALFKRMQYAAADFDTLPRVATLACTLAHVRKNADNKKFASAIGRSSFEDAKSAAMKPLRFQRLVAAEGEDEIARGFRRAVALIDGKVNVFDLAKIVLSFDREETKRRLVFDYYGAGFDAPPTLPAVP